MTNTEKVNISKNKIHRLKMLKFYLRANSEFFFKTNLSYKIIVFIKFNSVFYTWQKQSPYCILAIPPIWEPVSMRASQIN